MNRRRLSVRPDGVPAPAPLSSARRGDRYDCRMAHGTGSARASGRGRTRAIDLLPIVLFVGCYVAAEHYWHVPWWAALVYVVASLVTVVAYAFDKSRVKRSGRRVPEATLNILAFAGGWPGGILAQQSLRHKTQKASFRRKFWIAVVANILLFLALASPWWHDLLGTVR